jgi:virginiamycin B lyase
MGEGAVWVLDVSGQRVVRIDPTAMEVVEHIPLPVAPGDVVVAGEGGVWVTDRVRGAVVRIDPATNRVVATIRLGHALDLGSIAVGGGSIWVAVGEPLAA